MKHVGKIATAAALVLAVATPALAGMATESPAARKEMLMKQKACKKEASEQQFGVHVMKKRAFMKECMSRV
jgi:uncharacterized low-complexity protein